MILVGWEQPLVSPYDLMILDIHNCHYPRSACPPCSPNCQFLLCLLLVSHMPWTVLCPSFRSCQVEPPTHTSRCTLPNSHLRASCQCLRCWIRIYVQDANVCAVEFRDSPSSRQPILLTSFPAWPGQSIVQPMFVNNLRCRFSFDKPTAVQICVANLSHCWQLGMAASTLRHCFGQLAEACTSCIFDTVTGSHQPLYIVLWLYRDLYY